MRVTVCLPILVGDADIRSETTLEAAGADTVLVISTAAPDHALLVRTVYIGCGGQESGQAVDVTLARDGRATSHRVLADVPVTHARGRCLSDHAAVVQSHLEALTGEQVSVHVSDDGLAHPAERRGPGSPGGPVRLSRGAHPELERRPSAEALPLLRLRSRQLVLALAPAPGGGRGGILGAVLERDAVAVGEELDRTTEIQALSVLDELEDVAQLFSKGRNLYGAHLARAAARQAGSIVLCEGYTDVIALHQAGAQNTVGSLGTAVTERQVAELARLSPTVKLALDADQPGRQAMLRAGELAAARGLHARVIAVPAGRDPADVALGPDGPEAVATLIGASVPMVSFRVEHELTREPLTSAEAKDRAIDALRPVFAELPSSALREELLHTVATATQLPVAKVTEWLRVSDATPDPAAARALDPEIGQARAVAGANQARPPRGAATPTHSPLPGPTAHAQGSLPGPQSRVGEWER